MNTVTCPHCKKQVEISEAIVHELQAQVREEERKNLKAEFAKNKAAEQAEREKKLREEFELANKNREKELEVQKREKKALEEKLIHQAKTLKENEAKIKEEARKSAQQETSLEMKAIHKQLEDAREAEKAAKKANEELNRKLNQQSQQLQGEVLELDLEEKLHEAFPYDELKPVPKGINGGDIIQEIKNKYGNSAGSILWETKRTKTWDKKWLEKLKDDMRKINASDCVLVTEILPSHVRIYDRVDNVWVTSYEFALKLASVLRLGLMNVAIAKSAASHTDEQLKDLYRVITSDSFKNKFDARDEIITVMKKELEAEKSSTERRWERQRVNIEKLSRNNSQLYGELQAHIPSLKPLNTELLELDNGEN